MKLLETKRKSKLESKKKNRQITYKGIKMQLVNASEITEAWREKNILKGLKEKTVNPGFYISQKYRKLRALFLFFSFTLFIIYMTVPARTETLFSVTYM